MDVRVESKATLKTPAYAAKSATSPVAPFTIERREPGPHDVLIDILYCGICHSDIHQVRDEWGGSIFPMVPGHEIVGKVVEVGDHVSKWKTGDLVGVGCFVDSAASARPAARARSSTAKARAFRARSPITAMSATARRRPMAATRLASSSTRTTCSGSRKASRSSAAAPLLCAGITTYSPLKHFGVKAGDKVAVVGLGGLGHMAVKLAHAMGAEVTVLSHSREASGTTRCGSAPTTSSPRETRASSRSMPAASTSSSTRSRRSTITTPISTCCAATAPWCWWAFRSRRRSPRSR